jgi:hypothetical protein
MMINIATIKIDEYFSISLKYLKETEELFKKIELIPLFVQSKIMFLKFTFDLFANLFT